MKQILADMKTGYEILTKGYGFIKDIAEGNFTLHQVFLDKLFAVSPLVKGYYKTGEIITDQLALANAYKITIQLFRHSEWLRAEELKYLEESFGSLHQRSIEVLEQLAAVVTPRTMRMTDDERLQRIDAIHARLRELLSSCRRIGIQVSELVYERSRSVDELKSINLLLGHGN